MTTVAIYFLRDPRTSRIRYVGQTIRGNHRAVEDRRKAHLVQSRRGDLPKDRWIRALINVGREPKIEEVEIVPYAEANRRECYWMFALIKKGERLLNIHRPPSTGCDTRKRDALRAMLLPRPPTAPRRTRAQIAIDDAAGRTLSRLLKVRMRAERELPAVPRAKVLRARAGR